MQNKIDRLVYDVDEIQQFLGMKRTSIYRYLDKVYETQKPFRVTRIGRIYKIPKKPFDQWINKLNNHEE